jgi:murein DD-endopeptidase MepM/ murein hydrolase activator NlpD
VQADEPKTPTEGAPQLEEGGRAVATEPQESASRDAETPPAASTSRSIADAEKEADRERGLRSRSIFPKRGRVALALAGGAAALLGAVLVPMAAQMSAGSAQAPHVSAATLAASVAALEAIVDAGAPEAQLEALADAPPPSEPIWRIAELGSDSTVSLVETVLGHRPLSSVLAAAHLSHTEAQRLTKSLAAVHNVERLGPKDTLTIALDKASLHLVAYEFTTSPSDVWQGREEGLPDGTTKLEARKLKLLTQRVRIGKAVLVGADLRASFAEAGLLPVEEFLSMLDDALEGHAELSDIRPGARLRLIATQDQLDGAFVRWASLDAVEYFPANPNAAPVRVYFFGDGEGAGDSKRRHGWYDSKARQPLRGGWRSPVPLARIASRFNPHRMHPVLHVVMPHNGVDFAAPLGAPVYAAAAGVVASVGSDGPCGRKVEISHPAGITSVYCHLSRYATGLRLGERVEQRQLIGYVGQTGRVTGPHLHFGIRRNGVFVDPMTLRLDGVRVVPRALRDEFDRQRASLDKELDSLPLPASGGAQIEVSEPETFYEEP